MIIENPDQDCWLPGSGGSGKSTFIKQLKILYEGDYSDEERLEFRPLIYKAIRRTLKSIVAAKKELGLSFENSELEARNLET